jgi:ubiquinone/menaquinone biosynthesis C-methylase UbiE
MGVKTSDIADFSSRGIDVFYLDPEIVNQRQRTLMSLQIRSGEAVADVGCGNGLLTHPMALAVGAEGSVIAIDPNPEMIEKARTNCAGQDQITWQEAKAQALPIETDSVDALSCTQVLLYVDDVPLALSEMHRVLKPGGRLAIIETDWRGLVFGSSDDLITRKVIAGWDKAVASPNLPPKLRPLLEKQGFVGIKTEAIPIVNTSFSNNNFSTGMMFALAKRAMKEGVITETEKQSWTEDIKRRGSDGSYFFCVNRFLFSAVKP